MENLDRFNKFENFIEEFSAIDLFDFSKFYLINKFQWLNDGLYGLLEDIKLDERINK